MKPAVTFRWSDQRRAQPIERAMAAMMILGNRRAARDRRDTRVLFNRYEHRTVIVASGAVGVIERSKT